MYLAFLFPFQFKDENYKFDVANTNDFVLNYYAMDQFDSSYEGDPETELLTSVSSTLLGFENAKFHIHLVMKMYFILIIVIIRLFFMLKIMVKLL